MPDPLTDSFAGGALRALIGCETSGVFRRAVAAAADQWGAAASGQGETE
jgi:hypothetical protein